MYNNLCKARRSQTEVAAGCCIMCLCMCVYMKEIQDSVSFYKYASMAVCLVSVLVCSQSV